MTDNEAPRLTAKDLEKAIEKLKKNGVEQNGCQVVLDANTVYQIMLENERLRRKPDAETGLMPCGCGDIPSLRLEEDYYIVSCKTCGEASDYCYSKSHAINQWNNLVRQSVEKVKS